MPDYYDIDLIIGQSYCLRATAKDSSNNPIDLSSYTVRGGVKYNFSDNNYALNFNPTIYSAASGIIEVSLSGYMTSGLKIGVFPYDIEVAQTGIMGDGNVIKILRGSMNTWPEVSNF